jgi:TonB-dependent SusC/RagA subfamily outer membrane receptor
MKKNLLIIMALAIISSANAQELKEKPLVVINGRISGWDIGKVDPNNISSLDIRKSESAVADYGALAKNGVIVVTTKDFKSGDTTYTRKPLVIVDGELFTAELNSISPTRIQSIDVLKAKSKTELYGRAGKNGVIIITTKNPSKPQN